MRRHLIHSAPGNRSAIAFFAGWAMDSTPFRKLHKSGYDIYLFYDYRTVEPELYTSLFRKYEKVAVVAWSFGVAVANRLISTREETRIAVNGTAQGVDNHCGLPKPYNDLTLKRLSPETLDTFYHKVFADDEGDWFFSSLPQRPLDELAAELRTLGETEFTSPSPYWDKAYISEYDKIIPPVNQFNSWREFSPEVIADGAHGVDFQKIIDSDIVNKAVVAQRFTRKARSYEDNADVQRDMAAELMRLLDKNGISIGGKDILEVGIGTGFLTRLYCGRHPSSVTAVDLADSETLTAIIADALPDFSGTVLTADAERFVADKTDCYDVILTASTIQWFNSQRLFLSNCARALRKGGVLAIATFAPGTFHEITEITRSALTYYPIEWYRQNSGPSLQLADCKEDNIILKFSDPRRVLEHISLTGVNAVSHQPSTVSHTISLLRRLPDEPTLTYNPIYLIFKKI
ncbi:MAG: DUF452 family protein [Muribaculaceae bacterium]|nr:DUF452 family protein [Muribaculaceae bacterium]